LNQCFFLSFKSVFHDCVGIRKDQKRCQPGARKSNQELSPRLPPLSLPCTQCRTREWDARSAGLVNGTGNPTRKWGVISVTRLPDKFDDSAPSTRGLYSRPFQLCLLEIRVRNTWATDVFRYFIRLFRTVIFCFYVWRQNSVFFVLGFRVLEDYQCLMTTSVSESS
jgi:hypothetical protein